MFEINKDNFLPKYTVTKEMTDLINEIDQLLKQITISDDMSTIPVSIREKSSNQNDRDKMIKAYSLIDQFNPFSKDDIKKFHAILIGSDEIVDFRQASVVMTKQSRAITRALDYHFINEALDQLFDWYQKNNDHPLIKACAFWQSLLFIHPFIDGNGRTSRYVLTSFWSKYNRKLAYFPLETIVNDRILKLWYVKMSSIAVFDKNFNRPITFLLSILRNALKEKITGKKEPSIF